MAVPYVRPSTPRRSLAAYNLRRTRDRLNECSMMGLLGRLDARPWCSRFYNFGANDVGVVRSLLLPERVNQAKRMWHEVLRP